MIAPVFASRRTPRRRNAQQSYATETKKLAGSRFVARNTPVTLALYLLNGAAWLVVVILYSVASPGAPGSGAAMWLVLGLGQLYILARHYLKLVFYASQTAFFQTALACPATHDANLDTCSCSCDATCNDTCSGGQICDTSVCVCRNIGG